MTQPQPTILLVDDEPTLVDTLAYNLRREGYRVVIAQDGPTAVRLAYDERPDLIILDVMLPGMSGLDVARAVRRELTMPILMLSAREGEIDKVLGLELGADDYLTKPFSLRELLARVRAMLRRIDMIEAGRTVPATGSIGANQAAAPTLAPPRPETAEAAAPFISAGDLEIDPAGRTVSQRGLPVPLKPKEFDLLLFLAQHPGQVISRDVLLNRVWGYDFVGGTRTVDVHVRWLRAKLEPDAAEPQIIQTIYGVGYKFGQPVQPRSG
jgi:two-component system alkaline phosphatase synthesis response regulator PhoP